MKVSPIKVLQRGPDLLHPGEVITLVLCSIPAKESLTQTLFDRSIGREEFRKVTGKENSRMASSTRVEEGSSKLNRFMANIGLLRATVFPGRRFSGKGVGIAIFQSLELRFTRSLAKGLVGFLLSQGQI